MNNNLLNDIIEFDNACVYYYPNIINGKYGSHRLNSSMMSLDNHKKLIPHTSFIWHDNLYNINYETVEKIIPDETYSNEEGFLLVNNDWTLNFSHALNETLPKLLIFKELNKINPNLKLLIYQGYDKEYWYQIMDLLEIDKNKIVILGFNKAFKIKKLITQKICHGISHPEQPLKSLFFKSLRNIMAPKIDTKVNNKLIYIYRNDKERVDRNITNENEILKMLSEKYNVKIIDNLSEKNILEKCQSLYNSEIIISPVGANLMNLVFSNSPKYLIQLCSNSWDPNYFGDLINHLGDNQTKFIKVLGTNVGPNKGLSTDYFIDVDNLDKVIQSIY